MNFQSLVDQYNNITSQLSQLIKPTIIEFVTPYLTNGVESISVPCYRDYFCDGGPCDYSVRTYSMMVNDYETEYQTSKIIESGVDVDHLDKIRDEVADFFDSLPSDILEWICEDGLIYIDRNGLSIDDYDHD